MGKRWLCLILWTASLCQLQAQDADSVLVHLPDDSVLTATDSLDIFNLIDSLLTLEENQINSQLAIRLSYNSNVLYAGQTLGIEQFGLSPGVSYYHKSGFYGDLTAYWSKDFDPDFYLLALSAGYMKTFNTNVSINLSYDRYFPINNDLFQYKNTLSATGYLDFKPMAFSLNYSFYFSETSVHRIMPSFGFNFEKKKLWGLGKVSFSPAAIILFGNESWTEVEIIEPRTLIERLRFINRYGTPYRVVETYYNPFGIMNYTFTFPLTVSHQSWNFLVCYSYSIPKALEGETFTLPETGFIAASLSYYIGFRSKKFSF
jgi:hypothetical protein